MPWLFSRCCNAFRPACASLRFRCASAVLRPCVWAFRFPGWPPGLRRSFDALRQSPSPSPAEYDSSPLSRSVGTVLAMGQNTTRLGHCSRRLRCRGGWGTQTRKGGYPLGGVRQGRKSQPGGAAVPGNRAVDQQQGPAKCVALPRRPSARGQCRQALWAGLWARSRPKQKSAQYQ